MEHQHPEIDDLELLRTGEADGAVADHVASCPSCQAQLAQLTELAERLGTAAPPLAVPTARDEAIVALARRRAERIRRDQARWHTTRQLLRWAAPLGAAAAAVALMLALPFGDQGSPPAETVSAMALPAGDPRDVNGDGLLDIRDAFAVALALRDGQPANRRWDRTGDGQVDRHDVQALALAAVSVGDGRR